LLVAAVRRVVDLDAEPAGIDADAPAHFRLVLADAAVNTMASSPPSAAASEPSSRRAR